MTIKLLLALCLLLGVFTNATATACKPFKHRYFAVCDGNACEVAFSVKDVTGLPACSRRPVVLPVDKRVNAFVSAMVIELHTPAAYGIYQLTLDTRMWGSALEDEFAGFLEELGNTMGYDLAGYRCSAAAASGTQLAALLNKPGSGPLLIQRAADLSPDAVQSIREAFESQSGSDLFE
jgi:hypothetical protein